jgi:hypothetical protein
MSRVELYAGLKGALRSAFRKEERWRTTVSLIGNIGLLVSIAKISQAALSPLECMTQLEAYLWVSFFGVATLFVGWATLASKVRVDVATGKSQIDVRNSGLQIQHQMAEVVRYCADAGSRGEPIDFDRQLRRIADMLKEYLRVRLGARGYAITVKKVDGDRLKTIFRDGTQDPDARATGDDIPMVESCIYTRFKSDRQEAQKSVLIQDVKRLEVDHREFQQRADKAKFRSVIGFPLRGPVVNAPKGADLGPLKCANLFGFLSVDSPEPNAFDELYLAGDNSRNDAINRIPEPDMDLFYGLADSIATLVMLSSRT